MDFKSVMAILSALLLSVLVNEYAFAFDRWNVITKTWKQKSNDKITQTTTPTKKLNMTKIQRLALEMNKSIHSLEYSDVSAVDLEDWACIVYESMSLPSRHFHTVQHALDLSEGAHPIIKLSAFFHDTIYYSIDGGVVNDRVKELMDDIIDVDRSNNGDVVRITKMS